VVRQALPALAHLRCGHTCAQLAAGFGVGIAADLAAARKAFVIPDGTLPPIHRPPSLGPAKVGGGRGRDRDRRSGGR
jgi:hypothetical protein